MNTPILNPSCGTCQRLGRIAGSYADDSVAADDMIRELQIENEQLRAERDTFRALSAELMTACQKIVVERANLKLLVMRQRVALDDKSREDGNYSQWLAASAYVETQAEQPYRRPITKHGTKRDRSRPLPPLPRNLGLSREART